MLRVGPLALRHYNILQIPPTASWDEVRRAYHRLALRYHPDRPGGTDDDEIKFKQCADAYRLLREEELRRRLDRAGVQAAAPAPDLEIAEDAAWVDEVTSARPAARRFGPWRILAGVAMLLVVAGGACIACFTPSADRWERDHGEALQNLAADARQLASEGRVDDAIARYDEICRALSGREVTGPELRVISNEARVVGSHREAIHGLAGRETEALALEQVQAYAEATRNLREIKAAREVFGEDPVARTFFQRIDVEFTRASERQRTAEDRARELRAAAARDARHQDEVRGSREAIRHDAFLTAMARLSAGDMGDAVHLLYQAANLGESRAMYVLGDIYERGDEGNWALLEAVNWYSQAAAAGDRDAMGALGRMYLDGRGVGQDDRQAVEWLARAADAGHVRAMVTLATLLEKGRAGGAADPAAAAAWYQRAAAQGDQEAQRKLAALARGSGSAP